MHFFKKYFLFFVVIVFLIGLELISFYSQLLSCLPFLLLFIVLFYLKIIYQKKIDKDFFRLSICPFFFTSSLIFSFVVLTPQSFLLRQIVIFFASFLVYFLLKNINFYLTTQDINPSGSLANLCFFFNLITLFLLFSSFYNLAIFPFLTFWLIELSIIIIVSAIVYQMFWVYGFLLPKNFLFVLVITLVLAELFLAIYFLPTDYYVNGLFLTIFYYLLMEISYFFLLGKLSAKTIKTHFVIIIIVLLIIILTMRWS